ncbi:MAG TPA: GH25 family lysozyme [Longilinea sp.]|nr:GH25 family lysozyme [Longilinea sp.]
MAHELLIDVSCYQKNMDYVLLRASGLRLVIVKAGSGSTGLDPQLRFHVAEARAAGLRVALYHWIDPLHDGKAQAEWFNTLIAAVQPDFVAGDVEQWWADWDKWHQFRLRRLNEDGVPRLAAKQIDRVCRDFFTTLGQLTHLPALFYTSAGFVRTWCPQLLDWMGNYPLWLASYVQPRKATTTTWQDLPKYYPTATPKVLAGMPIPSIWQWSGDIFTLPGHDGPVDMNFMLQSLVDLDSAATPIELPYEKRKLKVGIGGLNVRTIAKDLTSQVLRVILPNEIIRVEKQAADVWLKLYGEPGWVHGGYTIPLA